MKIRIVRKETENYDNTNDKKYIEADPIRKNQITFEEVLSKIKLLRKKKIKRRLNIKRYVKNRNKFINQTGKIYIRKAIKTDENEMIEDMYVYNNYTKLDENYNEDEFSMDTFRKWKKQHEHYFFPSLNAPWQVRNTFRSMEDNLGKFERERFLKLKFELWIYVNRPLILQEKILDIIYGENEHKNYDKFVMGEMISIIKDLNTINGHIRLLKYEVEKKEKMYRAEKNYSIESDINILYSLIKELNKYLVENLVCNEIEGLSINNSSLVSRYKINNFYL